ncbi:MAG: rhamnogalacturonan acetylesterase [Pyrinomonadaceae bacterium]
MKFRNFFAYLFVLAIVGSVDLTDRVSPVAEAAAPFNEQKVKRLNFDFGPGQLAAGAMQVTAQDVYSAATGYGFEAGAAVNCLGRGGNDAQRSDFCTSDHPFFFSVALPEGNYQVTLTLGDRQDVSITTVKSESRRLMLKDVLTLPGKFVTPTFTVNIRNSQIATGGAVSLKPREQGVFHWDDKLTLEFSGKRPCIDAVEIVPVNQAITVYLAGDSTVTDQTNEPYAAWGQMLPRFFARGVAIANHAESGETLRAFRNEHRLDKILSQIRSGDYLFIQFTHNDQKPGADHVDPFTTYQEQLKYYIGEARQRGATPVLVTSMNRRTFDAAGKISNSLGDYPDAMRQTAKAEKVALIDLAAMSQAFYEALGPDRSVRAFVHYPAGTFPGQDKELKDDTHFNAYGAYELARCVVEGIRANKLGLVKYLVGDDGRFDPSHPDPLDNWSLPASPYRVFAKPAGS